MMIIFEQNLITNHIYLVFRKEEIKIMEDTYFSVGKKQESIWLCSLQLQIL